MSTPHDAPGTAHDPIPFRPIPAARLFALELPEPAFLVDRVLPVGAAGLLSAREKAGKGLLAIDLCACVALEEPFLGLAVRGGAAVYCAAEEHVRDVRARVAARLGDQADAPFYVLPLDGSTGDRLRLDDAEEMQRLWLMVEELRPALVVLDPLRELHERDEDRSGEMGPLLRPVRQLAHETETTVLVTHHQNKGGGFRGSTAIRAAFDLEWAFARTDDPDGDGPAAGTLRVEGRHGPREVVKVRLGDGLRWEVDGAGPTVKEPAIRARILVHLGSTDAWLGSHEIAEGLGVAPKSVQNALAEMARERPLPFAVRGGGVKGDPRQYRALAPRLDGIDPDGDGEEMVPLDPPPYRGEVGGNDPGAAEGAGRDRWTR